MLNLWGLRGQSISSESKSGSSCGVWLWSRAGGLVAIQTWGSSCVHARGHRWQGVRGYPRTLRVHRPPVLWIHHKMQAHNPPCSIRGVATGPQEVGTRGGFWFSCKIYKNSQFTCITGALSSPVRNRTFKNFLPFSYGIRWIIVPVSGGDASSKYGALLDWPCLYLPPMLAVSGSGLVPICYT